MAADTLIKEDFRPRRVAGGLFIFLGVPITLIFLRFGLFAIDSLLDALIVSAGPLMILGGVWVAFPRRPPAVKLRICDDRIVLPLRDQSIALADLQHITVRRPFSSNHDRLTFVSHAGEMVLDTVQLTHQVRDIINLVGIRLEGQGRYLKEGRTEIRGARNGIWTVHEGQAFEQMPTRAKLPHGRE